MTEIQLPNKPNSTFAFRSADYNFRITLRSMKGITLVTVADENGTLSAGVRAIPGQWLIPYKYLSQKGNFRFESEHSEDYPYYTGFNTDFKLVYYTPDEVEEIGW